MLGILIVLGVLLLLVLAIAGVPLKPAFDFIKLLIGLVFFIYLFILLSGF